MRIATWNINSVVSKIDKVTAWLTTAVPDVLCLQETKCTTDAFPYDALREFGYESEAHGDGRWNGVAIVSKVGLDDVVRDLPGQPAFEGVVEPRAIGATCNGVRLWSLYIPNGREPGHAHYDYKLLWLNSLAEAAIVEISTHADTPIGFLGDYNVAPTDADVWDRAQFEGATHVTPAERAAVLRLETAGMVEIMPRALKYDVAFTFWDYRQLAFPKNNGMRIDLVYASPSLASLVTDSYVDREARKGKGTSDHAPIVVDLSL